MPVQDYLFTLHVDPGEIYFLCGLFDAYGDFAVLRTVDRKKAVVELFASPFFIKEITALVDSLRTEFAIEIVEEGFIKDGQTGA
ncbi:MAG: DUF4911 domain-containing protein [Nitrospinota bacterium]